MREARFLDDFRVKCIEASAHIPSYAHWVDSLMPKASVATMLAEVNDQLSYFYGSITGLWCRQSSPYYLFLHECRYMLEKERAFQQRQELLQEIELTEEERIELVQYYWDHLLHPRYGLAELNAAQFDSIFVPYYVLTENFNMASLSTDLYQAMPALPPAWETRLLDYLYGWIDTDLSADVASALYSEAACNRLCDRIATEIDAGISTKMSLAHMRVLLKFSVEVLSDRVVLRRAQLITQLNATVESPRFSAVALRHIQLCAERVDRARINQLTAHAFNIGLCKGGIHAVHDSNDLQSGLSDLAARRVIMRNLAAYLDQLPEEKPYKPHLLRQLQQMQHDTEGSFRQVVSKPDLVKNRFFSIRAGWKGHVLSMVIAQIGGVTYLIFANRGGGSQGQPGLHIYKVNNPAALDDDAVIQKIRCNTDNRDYVLDRAREGDGLGKDLQLEPLIYIRQKPQGGERCSVVAVNKDIQCRLLLLVAQDMATRRESAGDSTALSGDDFRRVYDDAKPVYKAYRDFSRVYSAQELERGLREEERRMPAEMGRRMVVLANNQVMKGVEQYVDRKWDAREPNSMTPQLRESLLESVKRRRQWQVSCRPESVVDSAEGESTRTLANS